MVLIQLPCKDGVLCQHAICGGVVESRRRVLLREKEALLAGGTVGIWPQRTKGQPLQMQVQVQV